MFLYAMMAAMIGTVLTAVGKSSNSVAFSLCGGIMCFVSAIMFLTIAFS